MKRLQVILVLVMLVSISVLAQKVSGVVYLVDEPVKNAKVVAVDADNKVRTDENGYFSLNGDAATQVLVAYKGIKQAYVYNGTDIYADIVLVPSEKQLRKMIKQDASVAKCEMYLDQYSDSKYSDMVADVLEKQIFIEGYDAAVSNYNLAMLKDYLNKYPEGVYAEKALQTIDIVSWQHAKSVDTREAYNAYLSKFPKGEAVDLAKTRMAMLK